MAETVLRLLMGDLLLTLKQFLSIFSKVFSFSWEIQEEFCKHDILVLREISLEEESVRRQVSQIYMQLDIQDKMKGLYTACNKLE